jgi:endonuclease YncB( thermonuclease family)
MTATYEPGTDWAIDAVPRIVDGDTIRVIRSRIVGQTDDQLIVARDRHRNGMAIRLVTLDTPERGEPCYTDARDDVARWLLEHAGRLRIETWPGGGFDRLLGDVYVAGDRADTLSQWMLRYGNRGQGWDAYTGSKA